MLISAPLQPESAVPSASAATGAHAPEELVYHAFSLRDVFSVLPT
jgi:hypothetical protein